MTLSFLATALISALKRNETTKATGSGERISISRTVSALAVLYERARTAIEYREEHLLRRAAIERILKRRLILNENGRGIAEYLLKELLWAKYAPEDSIPVSKIDEIQAVVDKYIFLRNEITRGRPADVKYKFHEWLISSAAAEIEQKLAPDPTREAFLNFIFKYFEAKVSLNDESEQTKNIQVYIALHKAFAKSDTDFIRYELLKLSVPDLPYKNWKTVREDIPQIERSLTDIEIHLKHKVTDKLTRLLKKEMAPFLILRDLYEKEGSKLEQILQDEKLFKDKVDAMCDKRYEEIGKKLSRAGVRSIIYIFLTKMIFAFLLEYPFDRYIIEKVDYVAIGVNTLFPPMLMFLGIFGIAPPGKDNTDRILNRLKEILTTDPNKENSITVSLKTPRRRKLMTFIFTIMYVLTFLMVFGGIITFLTSLGFSIVSQMVFIFFASLVLFFAYRVRQTGKEYTVGQKESFLTPIMTFLLLPILNLGKWLSGEIARFNFLVALFDFVIEAPFKVIFEIFEEWFSFLRRKKDEII